MKWYELTELLTYDGMDVLCQLDPAHPLFSVMRLAPFLQHLSDHTLYIGTYSDFLCIPVPEQADISVILYLDQTPDISYLKTHAKNIIGIHTENQYQICTNDLQEIFSELHRMDHWIRHLYDQIHEGATLLDAVNLIAEYYQRPVNVVDSSFSVIAHSDNFSEFDSRLSEDQNRGYILPDIIKAINIRARKEQKLSHEPILIEDYENGTFIHYHTPILENRVQIGAFSIFLHPEEQLSFVQKYYLPEIAQTLSFFWKEHNISAQNSDSYASGLLTALFYNTNLSVLDIESRMLAYGHQLFENKYVVTAQLANTTDTTVAHLRSILQNILRHSICTTVDNHLVFLTSYEQSDSGSPAGEILGPLYNLPDSIPGLHIGISSRFQSLSEARTGLKQAQEVLTIGPVCEPSQAVYSYDDYRLQCMVHKLSETTNISLYYYPQLYALSTYDEEHDTSLLYTLFVYIFCFGDKSISYICQKLNIHKNTLYFRLSKIREFTGLDYEKPTISAMIIFTFTLMRMNGQIHWSVLDI